jgi:hypothetical protein
MVSRSKSCVDQQCAGYQHHVPMILQTFVIASCIEIQLEHHGTPDEYQKNTFSISARFLLTWNR